ncbi:MAG: hypothetical protein ACHQ5A_11900 [Opitutales bacterium]
MKRSIIIAFVVMMALGACGLYLSPVKTVGPMPDPPDDDWQTWVQILESKRFYNSYLRAHLLARGFDWSYLELQQRASFKAIPIEKRLRVRVLLVSQKDADNIADLEFQCLTEYIASIAEKKIPMVPKLPPRLNQLIVEYHDAAKAISAVLASEKEEPQEFRVEVEKRDNGRQLVFHLWHDSAFTLGNMRVAGNPGGKCRDIYYAVKARKASKSVFWQ